MNVPPDAYVSPSAPLPRRGLLAGRPLLRNAGMLAISRAVTLVTGLIVTAWLGRKLGPESYGILGFAMAIVSYFGMAASIGHDALGAREIARHPARTRAITSHLFSLRLVLAAAALAGFALFVALIEKPAAVKLVLAIHGIWLIAMALSLDFIYQGRARMGLIAARDVTVALLTLGGILVLVRAPSDVTLAAVVMMGAVAAGAALLLIRCRRDYGAPVFRFDPRIWKILLKAGVPIAAVGMLVTFYRNLDTAMLGFMRPAADVGLYTAAFKFFMTSLAPVMILVGAFTPVIAAAWGAPDDVRRVMGNFTDAVMAVMAPIAAVGVAFAPEILGFLFGSVYLAAATATALLMAGAWLAALQICYAHPLLLWRHQGLVLGPLAVGAALNGGLNWVLIPRHGIEGAAFATFATEAVLAVWFAIVQFRLARRLPLAQALIHLTVAAAAVLAVRHLVGSSLEGLLPAPWGLLAAPALSVLVYGVLVLPLWWGRLFGRHA